MGTDNSLLGGFVHYHQLLAIARRAAEDAKAAAKSERDVVNNVPLISIVFAAAACETCVNELAAAARLAPTHPGATEFYDLMEDLERSRVGIRVKLMMAKRLLTGRAYVKGAAPFQGFDILENVRNQVVHGKVSGVRFKVGEAGILQEELPPLLEQMRSLNILAEFPRASNVVAGTLMRLSTPAVAAWSYTTAVAIIDDLLASVPKEWGALLTASRNLGKAFDAEPIRDVRVHDQLRIRVLD